MVTAPTITMSDAPVVVSIRLSRPVHERLVAAAGTARKTVGEFGRELISTALANSGKAPIPALASEPLPSSKAPTHPVVPICSAGQTHDQVVELRRDIGMAVHTLLVITQTLPPDEAKRFVEERFT